MGYRPWGLKRVGHNLATKQEIALYHTEYFLTYIFFNAVNITIESAK